MKTSSRMAICRILFLGLFVVLSFFHTSTSHPDKGRPSEKVAVENQGAFSVSSHTDANAKDKDEDKSTAQTRIRRDVNDDVTIDSRDADEGCHQCNMVREVSFAEFGWISMIMPRRYAVYYGASECPYRYLPRPVNSQILREASIPLGHGVPCCTPGKLSAVPMVYYDNNMNIVYSKIPGMVGDSCGCS